jgi:hypothetical protein
MVIRVGSGLSAGRSRWARSCLATTFRSRDILSWVDIKGCYFKQVPIFYRQTFPFLSSKIKFRCIGL